MLGTILASLLSLILTSGTTSMNDSQFSSAQLLMLPRAGCPLSLKQVEEHSRRSNNGSLTVEFTVTGYEYRDSAGRVRVESEIRDQVGNSSGLMITITDPVAHFQTVLVNSDKVAYRMPIALSGEGKFSVHDAADGQDAPHQWKVTTEDEGEKTIDGFVFKGSRIVTSAEDTSGLVTTIDQWYSDQLKVIGAIDRSGPYKAYTVRIQQLQIGEPESKLFEVPSDYKVIEVKP